MLQKKKYDRVKMMDDDEDDEKDLIADEIFPGDGDGEGDLEEGDTIEEPLPQAEDEEGPEDEESGRYSVVTGYAKGLGLVNPLLL